MQNTICDADGNAVGQFDFKDHGTGGPHGHVIDPPGTPRGGHGAWCAAHPKTLFAAWMEPASMREVIMSGLDKSASVSEFLDRFLGFEDGVITRISIVLPRGDREGRQVELEIQALDRKSPAEGGPSGRLFGWKLVRIFMRGIEEYSFSETMKYPLQILSDGLKIGFLGDRYLLDLDPGPDEWSPLAIRDSSSSYSKQYIVAKRFWFEVSDGPFI